MGEWLVKPLANKLICDTGDTRVEPKVMDLLVYLAARQGDVVTRNELLAAVWERVVVNEEALTRTISELRRALGDAGEDRKYIRTIPKRGYSLVHRVENLNVAEAGEQALLPSVAVLPFRNLSPAADNEYFSDGLTEELICALAQIDGLHVPASRSVFAFKAHNLSFAEIGAKLGVNHVLDGTVSKFEQNLRVTAQLIEIESGTPIWASRFDEQFGDVFRIQGEIASAVVRGLSIQLGIARPMRVAHKTSDLKAYELFLKGRLKYQNEQPGMEFSGTRELEQAIGLAPDFPDAQGLYALVKTLNSISEPYCENAEAIRTAFESALSSNPFQAEALVAKAIAVRAETWDWAAVKSMFEKAMAAAPNCPQVLIQFATRYYRATCQFDEAERLLEKAIALDPINPGPHSSLSFVLRYTKRFEESLEEAERALAINPQHGYANLSKILGLASLEEFDRAQAQVRTLQTFLPGDDLLLMNCIGRLHAAMGDIESARRYVDQVRLRGSRPDGAKYLPLAGWIELILGNVEAAVPWLDAALDRRISQVVNVRNFVDILPHSQLRHPEIQRLLGRMNLDDASVAGMQAAAPG